MNQVKDRDYMGVPRSWFSKYKSKGVDITNFVIEKRFWRDAEVLKYMSTFGIEYFSKIAIWDVDWRKIASEHGYKNIERYSDPRNNIQKIIHCYLNKTQKYYPNKILIFIDILIKHLLNF